MKMRASIFISFFLFVGFGETLLTLKEIEARLQSLELSKSEFEVEIRTLELSNTKLKQEVNNLKDQVAELLRDETNQNIQDQAECEY